MGTKHGERADRRVSPEYSAWRDARYRCNSQKSPDFAAYGARGVRFCPAWNSFETFLADVGRRPGPGYSLDRIDNDGDYEPGNVRWATTHTQRRNQRRTKLSVDDVRLIRAGGGSTRAVAAQYGIAPKTVSQIRRFEIWRDI